ncbi:MAG: hypothetical protein ACXVIU_12050 [Halobacteriota archaeon]
MRLPAITIKFSIRNALKDRPDLQLILLLNETRTVELPAAAERLLKAARARSKTPNDRLSQDRRLCAVVDRIRGGKAQVTTVLHRKIGIVDDLWTAIGNANLDGP